MFTGMLESSKSRDSSDDVPMSMSRITSEDTLNRDVSESPKSSDDVPMSMSRITSEDTLNRDVSESSKSRDSDGDESESIRSVTPEDTIYRGVSESPRLSGLGDQGNTFGNPGVTSTPVFKFKAPRYTGIPGFFNGTRLGKTQTSELVEGNRTRAHMLQEQTQVLQETGARLERDADGLQDRITRLHQSLSSPVKKRLKEINAEKGKGPMNKIEEPVAVVPRRSDRNKDKPVIHYFKEKNPDGYIEDEYK